MVSGPDKLTTDFEEVQNTLELYPSINVIQVEGQPPDKYEIEYQLQGYVRDVDGSIRLGSQHRIRISLPFGYPHFPPTVKPLTSLFHPDIDPDAVRIAAYWQENPTLPELILHIGEMICGKIYNLEDPFNQEAADWYAEHLEDLPLDSVHVADIETDDAPPDAVDDAFDLLGLEDDASEDLLLDEQLDLIRLRIEQKEITAAGELLAEIPQSTSVPDREEIEHVISSALRESSKLITEAEALEDKGAVNEARDILEQVGTIAVDAPGLEALQMRLDQAMILAESFGDDEVHSEESGSRTEPIPAVSEKKQTPKTESKPSAAQINTPGLPLKPILAGIGFLVIVGAGAMLYFRDSSALKQAETKWQQASELAAARQYQNAEEAARAALAPLDKILILRSRKDALKKNIAGLLNDPTITQGLQGKMQYKDQYLPVAVVKKLQELEKLTNEADVLIKSGKITKAITAYGVALNFARTNDLQAQAQSISQTINNLRFEETMASARKSENAKEWENAAATYQRALEISKTLADTEGMGEVSKRLAAATFRHELDQSKTTFTEAQWQQTIKMLEDAKEILDKNPDTVSAQERKELERLLADSRLYQILSLARKGYEDRDWNTALAEYQKSLDLLKEQQVIFGDTHKNAPAKIKKTMLMIKISRAQSKATAAEQKNDLKTAVDNYKAIKELVTSSDFAEDSDLIAIKNKAVTQIRDKSLQLALNDKLNWLKNNFETIFHKAYPSSRSSRLTHPKVTFLKEEKGKQFFSMTCMEKSQGSAFRLQVNYQYNLSTGKWSIYYNQ